MSQLNLAVAAGTTPRYVSFIETGRSRPGRDMVLRLAEAMDVPIRERNVMLSSAGLPPAFPASDLDDPSMQPVADIVDRVLERQNPYPAWAVQRGYHFVAANRAGEALFPGLVGTPPESLIDLWFSPGPFREMIDNWQDVVWAGLAGLRRHAMRDPDPVIAELLARAERHSATLPRPDPAARPSLPVICPRLRMGDQLVQTISTVLRFETAVDVGADELHVELMFPADAAAEAFFRERAEQGPPAA